MTSKTQERKIQRKQKRLQHLVVNDCGITCTDNETQNLAICNAGLATGLNLEVLVDVLTRFGSILDVILLREKSYCFVKCIDQVNAVQIYHGMHGKSELAQNNTVVYLSFCTEVPAIASNDPSRQPLPPGLIILDDFVTRAEEQMLMELIDWDKDRVNDMEANGIMKHRQVKHFGYEFRYDTNNVDVETPLNEKIPSECNFLWKKLKARKITGIDVDKLPDQLTINKYEPGQGIPLHVDTHSAFADAIVSLSLGSDIVMEFRKPTNANSKEYVKHVSASLPRRSLLIMSGESRYGWKHGITPRKIDVVHNKQGHLTTKYRNSRISYTFRWLKSKPCNCEFSSLCDTCQSRANKDTSKNPVENPSQCELENVHRVYNEIANHFSETRHSPWPQVTEFIEQFCAGSVLIDIGCGNGKYLPSSGNILKIGCDRSEGLLDVCRDRGFNVFQCDCLALPIKSRSVDGCISIAVIHHLASKERRIQAITEMIRILVPMGRGLIYVWAKNQALRTKSSYLRQNTRNNRKNINDDDDDDAGEVKQAIETTENDSNVRTNGLPIHTNRTQFEHTDILVPWKLKCPNENAAMIGENSDRAAAENKKTFLRYYHVFEENELEELFAQIPNVSIEKCYYDQGNWCVIFQKDRAEHS